MNLSAKNCESEKKANNQSQSKENRNNHKTLKLSLAALGVVFGDIGTSPLYAIRECFHGEYGITPTFENVIGILSLIFWTLLLIVTFKYLAFILRVDNNGEGGVIALAALVRSGESKSKRVRAFLLTTGLFAACLLYGDGMITPAISVLSAVEGIRIITPVFEPYIIPLTILILGGLFLIQRHGTARVGGFFGPVILLWLCSLAVLGLFQVFRYPNVLVAILPWHAFKFLYLNKLRGFLVLGAVFLVATGTEALYADMGHFGRRPIRLTWGLLVFPTLILNYFGQGALLLSRPQEVHHPFYALVPGWAMIPMVFLATFATIIASQAVITGTFSLTRQAVQLGYLPRLNIKHTSTSHIGQIYVAPVNWLLMVCTIGLVLGFRTSSQLAAAYGVAVTSTMLTTTFLFFAVAVERWGWNIWKVIFLTSLFFVVDFSFFAANIGKIFHGAWFPLVIAAVFFTVMLTWRQGRKILACRIKDLTPSFDEFMQKLDEIQPQRVKGQAIFLAGDPDRVPTSLIQNMKHNKIVHSETVLLHISSENIPRVPSFEKVTIEKLGGGFYKILAHFGFMEKPNINTILALLQGSGLDLRKDELSFYLGRERISVPKKPQLSRWRSHLFRIISRNATNIAVFFDIPSDQIIEVGVQIEL
jgi:KUP system potassium uptake protein